MPFEKKDSILSECIEQLRLKPFQTAKELASKVQRAPSAISAILLQNCHHKYARVRRTEGRQGYWVYCLYHHTGDL